MARVGTATALLASALVLAACTGARPNDGVGTGTAGTSPTSATAQALPSAAGPGALGTTSLSCPGAIDGAAPPSDYTVIGDAVGLPTSPAHPALQTAPSGVSPRLFAKTGLVVRAFLSVEIDVPDSVGPDVALGWNNGPIVPSRHFVVPPCPDRFGTGWIAYPGGYWADEPLCLPLDVRVRDDVQRVEIGVGTACAGQSPPPTP